MLSLQTSNGTSKKLDPPVSQNTLKKSYNITGKYACINKRVIEAYIHDMPSVLHRFIPCGYLPYSQEAEAVSPYNTI